MKYSNWMIVTLLLASASALADSVNVQIMESKKGVGGQVQILEPTQDGSIHVGAGTSPIIKGSVSLPFVAPRLSNKIIPEVGARFQNEMKVGTVGVRAPLKDGALSARWVTGWANTKYGPQNMSYNLNGAELSGYKKFGKLTLQMSAIDAHIAGKSMSTFVTGYSTRQECTDGYYDDNATYYHSCGSQPSCTESVTINCCTEGYVTPYVCTKTKDVQVANQEALVRASGKMSLIEAQAGYELNRSLSAYAAYSNQTTSSKGTYQPTGSAYDLGGEHIHRVEAGLQLKVGGGK